MIQIKKEGIGLSEKKQEQEEILEHTVEETDETKENNSVEQTEETINEANETMDDQLNDLTQQLNDMEDKFLRAQAEIANITRRNKTEREQLARYRCQDLGKGILGSLDNLERALEIEVDNEQAIRLKKGVEMVLESLLHALKEQGITEIPALNQPFDPTLHQAVQTVPADDTHQKETIVRVLQKGYQLHDRVLRPTMVIVAQ